MNVRIKKEFQSLFWPWFMCVVIGFLPLVVWWATSIMFASPNAAYDLIHWRQNSYFIANSIYVMGVAILVALPFGRELQERTLTLLLSQPYPRFQLWRDKVLVTLAAILSLTLAHAAGYLTSPSAFLPNIKFAGILLLTVFGSGIFWSVVLRSVIGGVAFSLFSLTALFLLANALTDQYIYIQGISYHHTQGYYLLFLASFFIAPLFLLLSWRKFSRLQPPGNWELEADITRSSDQHSSRPNWIRSRGDNPVFNLVLKELRLLKPVIQLMLLFTGLWVAAAVLPGQRQILSNIVGYMMPVYLTLFIILAGCVSLGREKGMGIHVANLTVPVSPGMQWLVKNSLACGLGLIGSVFLIVMLPRITGIHQAMPFLKFLSYSWFGLLTAGVLVLSFIQISFAAATIANQLLHAAFLAVIIVIVSVAIFSGAFLLGHQLELPVKQLAYSLVVHNQTTVWHLRSNLEVASIWVWALSCLSITYAGWKCFRQLHSEKQNLLQTLKLMLVVTLSLGLLHGSLHKSLDRDTFLESPLYQETKAAFLSLAADIPRPEIYHERIVHFQELLDTGKLSRDTQIWLSDSTFKVTSAIDISAGYNKPVIRVTVYLPKNGSQESIYLRPRLVKNPVPAAQNQ